MRIAHTMIRVNDLDASVKFYTEVLGMNVLRKMENESYRYTLVFVGYGDLNTEPAIELTYNWDTHQYDHGNAFGHLCLEVDDVYQTCQMIEEKGGEITRAPGPLKGGSSIIAFFKDPNGYQIELVEKKVR